MRRSVGVAAPIVAAWLFVSAACAEACPAMNDNVESA